VPATASPTLASSSPSPRRRWSTNLSSVYRCHLLRLRHHSRPISVPFQVSSTSVFFLFSPPPLSLSLSLSISNSLSPSRIAANLPRRPGISLGERNFLHLLSRSVILFGNPFARFAQLRFIPIHSSRSLVRSIGVGCHQNIELFCLDLVSLTPVCPESLSSLAQTSVVCARCVQISSATVKPELSEGIDIPMSNCFQQ
jgi:hypothetical protein